MFKLGARKLHSPKYKKFFFFGGKEYKKFCQSVFFLFFEPGARNCPSYPYNTLFTEKRGIFEQSNMG